VVSESFCHDKEKSKIGAEQWSEIQCLDDGLDESIRLFDEEYFDMSQHVQQEAIKAMTRELEKITGTITISDKLP
jgi:hypothetical protein